MRARPSIACVRACIRVPVWACRRGRGEGEPPADFRARPEQCLTGAIFFYSERVGVRLYPIYMETTWAYLAGLIDGEGHVELMASKGKESLHRVARLRIENTCPRMIAWLLEHCGGAVYERQPRPRCKLSYRWGVSGAEASLLLQRALPYLRTKKQHAKVLIEFAASQMTSGHRNYTASVQARHRVLIQRLAQLNRRGVI